LDVKKERMAKTKHIGFKKAARSISAKEHIPMKNANAILASASRGASENARHRNKYIDRVRGGNR
jgi:hypothetical protein